MRTKARIVGATLALLLMAAPSASAGSITLNINMPLPGEPTPGSAAPWATLTFEDIVGGVRLSVQSSLETPSEFIGNANFGVAFNVAPSIRPADVGFVFRSDLSVGMFKSPTINKSGQNAQNFSPETGFDFRIGLPTNGGAQMKFNGIDRAVYDLTLSGLTALDFAYANAGGWFAVAHIQGLADGGSAKVGTQQASYPGVPDGGATLLLLGCALAGLGVLGRKL